MERREILQFTGLIPGCFEWGSPLSELGLCHHMRVEWAYQLSVQQAPINLHYKILIY